MIDVKSWSQKLRVVQLRPRDAWCSTRGGSLLRLNFRLKGYVSRQYLWTVRCGNGYGTIMPLEIFTQRNFVADCIGLELNFIKKSLFEPSLGRLRGYVRTPSIARWKARGRLPIRHDWPFFAILRLRCYKRKSVEVGIFWRVDHFERKFQTEERHPPTTVGVRKLEWLPFVKYQNIRSTLFGFVTKHACDRRTDGRTDG